MGYRHQSADMLAAAVDIARTEGLAAVTFRRVARSLGTNDRTVVYYFPTKSDLISAVLAALGAELQEVLDQAFGQDPTPPDELMRRAWPVLSDPKTQPVFSVFFEIIGLAAAGTEPYASLAPMLLDQWIAWLEPSIDIADPQRRRREALAILARIDGLLLVRTVAGADAAQDAAQAMGLRHERH